MRLELGERRALPELSGQRAELVAKEPELAQLEERANRGRQLNEAVGLEAERRQVRQRGEHLGHRDDRVRAELQPAQGASVAD